jgi:predicted PhzF superfamily epimerase YddE/YHI9
MSTRRDFIQLSVSGLTTAVAGTTVAMGAVDPANTARRFHFVQIDVFSSQRLLGNPLAVFPNAQGLSDAEMQDIARETNLQETTFVFPRDPAVERNTLQSLRPDLQRVRAYFEHEPELTDFYYITRDTKDPAIGLRSRGIYADGEDPATGSAAGSTAAWMVRYGLANSDRTIHIEQGVEIRRPSQIFARAERQGDKVLNVRVGGNAVEIAEGEFSL